MLDLLKNLFGEGTISGWDVAFAVVALLGAWIASRYLGRAIRALLTRVQGLSPELTDAAARIAKYFVMILGAGIALAFLGANVQPLLAGVVVIAIIAFLVLRGVADNFGASIVLRTRMPIRLGDEVESQGWRGVVQELNGRSVVLRTSDGTCVHLPNSALLSEPLVNHSEVGARRTEIEVRVGGVAPSVETILDAVRQAHGVLADPPADVLVVAVERTRTTLAVRFWHEPRASRRTASAAALAVSQTLRDGSEPWTVNVGVPDPVLVPRYEV